MSLISIIQYESLWNPGSDVGQIRILLQDDPDWILLPIETPEEFIAISHMLTQHPVMYDPASESIVLPARPV